MGKQGRKDHPCRFATEKDMAKDAVKYEAANVSQSRRNRSRHQVKPPKLAAAAQSSKTAPASKQEPGTRYRQDASLPCFRTRQLSRTRIESIVETTLKGWPWA